MERKKGKIGGRRRKVKVKEGEKEIEKGRRGGKDRKEGT